jgi:hypothetical protein
MARNDSPGRGRSNPRNPGADYFVRGGEQRNREVRNQSAITTYRRVDPDNPKLANCVPFMAKDFTEQLNVVPVGVANGANHKGETTMNAGGKPAMTLPNIQVGAGQDDKGKF